MTSALWQRMDAIERFAADVAHEIKNPLTSLKSAVETAARVEDPVKQRKLLALVREDVERLDRLISDISDASRLDAELSRGEVERVAIDRMLEALVEVHGATTSETEPQLVLTLGEAAGGRAVELAVMGIEGRLVQVFRNLIANAISFSPPGGTIRIAAQRRGDRIEVTIDDDGPGIPDGKLEAIFERFYSERPAAEKFGTHSGLGLSISKQIVEAHRGTIAAANRRAVDDTIIGARFTVQLPVA
jgi:two-component system sensor histidine kinase ChvG